MSRFLIIAIIFLPFPLFTGCVTESDVEVPGSPPDEIAGFKPIYRSIDEIKNIQVESPRDLENPGKIFVKGDFIYINEILKGVHVINNIDPQAPQNIAFINIPGNVDIASKGNIFYVDNYTDLVALEFTNENNIRIVKRITDVFPSPSIFPEQHGVYFECVDKTKGAVIGWQKAILKKPECYRR